MVFGLFSLFSVLPILSRAEEPVLAQTEAEIRPVELEIKGPIVLPTSGFYPIKDFFRKVRLIFAFSPLKKAELRLKFANEKILETKEIAKTVSPELVEKSLNSYQKESEKVKNEIEKLKKEDQGKFLEKYTAHALKQQMVLENIASQVKGDVYEKILANRERHLERFGKVMEKVEDKEKLKEEIRRTINEVVAVAPPVRAIKVIETIREIEEKIPEIKEIEEEMIREASQSIKILPPEIREVKIKEQIKIFANPLITQEIVERIGKEVPEIAPIPAVEVLPLIILQEKLVPLTEEKKIEVLEKMTKERIRHLERLQEVKEKLETLPAPAIAPEVLKEVIEKQLRKIEERVEEMRVIPVPPPALEKIKKELKESPKIKEEMIKRAPAMIRELKLEEIKFVPPALPVKPSFKEEEKIGFCGWSTESACKTDADCLKSGCSGQVCQGRAEEPIVTTCEWRDCYNTEVYGVKCGCFARKCQWSR